MAHSSVCFVLRVCVVEREQRREDRERETSGSRAKTERSGSAARAVAFLEGVCSVYDFAGTFVAGQEAIVSFGGLLNDGHAVDSACVEASLTGCALRTTACRRFTVGYLP